MRDDVFEDSVYIANIYSNKGINNNQISIVDVVNSAYLNKYRDLILVTTDNGDYPLCIHDRLFIKTIDAKKEIITLGFYDFNSHKYQTALISFPE